MRALSRHPILSTLVLLALAGGCGGSQSCGCATQPLDKDLAKTDKVYDGIQAEISPAGFAFIEQNFSGIVNNFMPGGLSFPIPPQASDCSRWTTSLKYRICHQSPPCNLTANVHDVGLATAAPNKLSLAAQVDISGSPIPIQICDWGVKVSCNIQVHVANKPVSADVIFGHDPVTDALTFDIQNVAVSLQGSDFSLNGGFACSIGDIGFIKNFIAGLANSQIKSQIATQVKQQIDSMTCMPCNYFNDGCANGLDPSAAASCNGNNWCENSQTTPNCIRKQLGLVGKMDAGAALASLMPGIKAPLDLDIGLGQAQDPTTDPVVPSNNGPLDLRLITGASADVPSPCVPDASSLPDTSAPPRVDFATEASNVGVPYMVGLGVSDNFLNKFFYELYRSGGLCLNVGTDTTSLLTTGLFKTFLPSLDSLTEGKNTPMVIALRPKDRPTVDIGKGTYHTDPQGNTVLDEPLLTIHMHQMHLDFYAMLDQRYVRLFSLKVDIDLPLGLAFTPNNQIIPILGDLSQLVSNITAEDGEVLAEDPSTIANLIPALIGLVQPALAGALKPIALPAISGFALNVNKIGGMVPMSTPGLYAHLGILADLALTPAPPATARVETRAALDTIRLPDKSHLVGGPGHTLVAPTAVIDVEAFDARRASEGLEWQYQIDGGFWSPFQQNPVLSIQSPIFLLQGHHTVAVRAREVGDYRSLDPTPARVNLLVDWTAPTGRLEVDPSTGSVVVHGHDLVTAPEKLQYAFSFDGSPFTSFSTDARTTLPAGAGKLVARIRDEAGNSTDLTWIGSTFGMTGPSPDAAAGGCATAGGSTSGGAIFFLLIGLSLALVRRRR